MFSNKRGESLVEVVVALGILSFIFMGVINIIAGSITLNSSSRSRMETVARVQKNLNEYLAGNTNTGACTIAGRLPIAIVPNYYFGDSGCEAEGSLANTAQTCYWLEIANLQSPEVGDDVSLSEVNESLGLNNENFIKVISHGKWYTRILGEQEFEVSRVIRNN